MIIQNNKNYKAIGYAILAAGLYAISFPFSKILLKELNFVLLAAFLYLGAGLGTLLLRLLLFNRSKIFTFHKKELPYVYGMILLDVIAPIALLIGLMSTNAATASLLNNFEIVATAIIALLLFKEHISKKLWLAIFLITIASIILSIENFEDLKFSYKILFIILACICWGFENNCTRMLSHNNPLDITIIKGFGSGIISLLIAYFAYEWQIKINYAIAALLLGFAAYGMSIFFYVYAQRFLGAAKTSTYYAIAPFIGVILSFIFLKENLNYNFWIALIIMISGTYFATTTK